MSVVTAIHSLTLCFVAGEFIRLCRSATTATTAAAAEPVTIAAMSARVAATC